MKSASRRSLLGGASAVALLSAAKAMAAGYLPAVNSAMGCVNPSDAFQWNGSSMVCATTGAPVLCVTDPQFGAICNGSSNPASTKYGSLAALQAVYGTTLGGVTIALTNELDWLAIQLAVKTAENYPTGGSVYLPARSGGKYVLSNSNSVSDGSGTILLPVVLPFFPNSTPIVNLYGDGEDTTVLHWPTDLGSARFGIVDASRGTTATGNAGIVYSLTLQGPGTSFTIGTAPASMGGYGIGSGKHLQDFGANGFNSGIDFVGGQNKFHRLRLENNYYNIYFSTPDSSGLVGDTLFDRCIFQNAMFAGIGVNHAASIVECHFEKCTWDTEPWGIFKETNSGSPASAIIATGCTFINSQFEGMGNGAIGDDRLTTGGGAAASVTNLEDCRFIYTMASWNASFKLSAYGAFALVSINDGNNVIFDGVEQWAPGSSSVVALGNGAANGMTIKGDIASLLGAINAATAKNLNGPGCLSTIRVINTAGNYWEGYTAAATGTVPTVNELVNVGSGQYGNIAFAAACGGTTADAPAGVVVQVNGTAGGLGTQILVADRGFVTVKSSGTYSTTPGQTTWLRTGSAGAAIVASSSNDTSTSPIVGSLASTPGSTTPSTVLVKLKGDG